ncbi:conserved hypothetical protein [Echinococcus multilocularis]|uniref:Uncharacterized protein n=1 Tax=Echinococcus multilocularis TaxID=6211 RepID=A0A068Y7N7_ECHMU|nr:conserved hypothetical protein [Echinococcus multilocularis]
MEEKSESRVPPPRVRIFECAHDGIQELFNRDSSKATKPMDERNFPKSFWIPPTKEHSSLVLRFDPRIPPDEQKWGMTIEELDQIHANYARRQKFNTHSLEGHRQLPASPISVLSLIDSAGMTGVGRGGEPTSCCSTLPGSPGNAAGQLVSGGAGGGGVRPASVPRMQHPGPFAMTHVAPTPRALPMNLLPPQGSKPMASRQQHQQQQQHIAHTKSSSQPVPMTVSGVSGNADSCMGGGGGGGSGGYALCPSSSLTRLHHPSYGATLFPSSEPLPATSSGHLAQDMEELSLSRGTGETPLPHLQQMFCTTPLLPLLSQSSMPPPGTAPTTGEYGASGSVATQQISSAQHSHQSSMDSGVGPSVAGGHSIPSANQTPEHTKVACFDSSMDNCEVGPDFLSYSAAHLTQTTCCSIHTRLLKCPLSSYRTGVSLWTTACLIEFPRTTWAQCPEWPS